MSVHKKLMEARIKLQNTKLTKSGFNKFAGYDYFELGDFLPQIQQIFYELGLCGTISFHPKENECEAYADLTVFDIESKSAINFVCPIAQASLKGCHEVQNLGASMTYTRRYLWVNALEIVEHDALDATTGKDVKNHITKPTDNQAFKPDHDQVIFMESVADSIVSNKTDIQKCVDLFYNSKLDNDEMTWIWAKLQPYSTLRADIKKYHESLKQKG